MNLPLRCNIDDICYHLRLKKDAVFDRIENGELLGTFKDKGRIYIKGKDLEQYVDRQKEANYQ